MNRARRLRRSSFFLLFSFYLFIGKAFSDLTIVFEVNFIRSWEIKDLMVALFCKPYRGDGWTHKRMHSWLPKWFIHMVGAIWHWPRWGGNAQKNDDEADSLSVDWWDSVDSKTLESLMVVYPLDAWEIHFRWRDMVDGWQRHHGFIVFRSPQSRPQSAA